MPTACQFVVLALDDMFGLQKGIVIACVVRVEVSADEEINVIRAQVKFGESLNDIFFAFGSGWSLWWRGMVNRGPTINKNILSIPRLKEITSHRQQHCLPTRKCQRRVTKLEEVESLNIRVRGYERRVYCMDVLRVLGLLDQTTGNGLVFFD